MYVRGSRWLQAYAVLCRYGNSPTLPDRAFKVYTDWLILETDRLKADRCGFRSRGISNACISLKKLKEIREVITYALEAD